MIVLPESIRSYLLPLDLPRSFEAHLSTLITSEYSRIVNLEPVASSDMLVSAKILTGTFQAKLRLMRFLIGRGTPVR